MHPLCLTSVLTCLLSVVFGATSSVEWCYHLPTCDDSTWAMISENCNGTRQSPINISTGVDINHSLEAFNLTGFDDRTAMSKIMNTGKTVKVEFKPRRLKVRGGSLSADYDTLQFHLHWGNLSSAPGSEHTVNGHRYPMEMHIISAKSIYNGSIPEILRDSEGLASLGFFIEVDNGTVDQPASWRSLVSYLANITEKDQYVNVSGISVEDLIGGVDTCSYYRYLGSLTTPSCNEAVVWTVFQNPIKVSQNLIDQFSTTVRIGNGSSPFITNNYRNLQPLSGR